ncbi:hypothetical protein C4577_05780 [Candidatus Parcubacteria bacterium]|nr:MAG: hypothetical protein C4577_05780 [Candidatus Parcubacteria bacterium]
MEKYEKVKTSLKQMLINNFLGGIAWGLGVTIGLSIVLSILGIILKNVNLIPVVGQFVSQIVDFVLQNNPNLLQ